MPKYALVYFDADDTTIPLAVAALKDADIRIGGRCVATFKRKRFTGEILDLNGMNFPLNT